jgi:hypothetical protein
LPSARAAPGVCPDPVDLAETPANVEVTMYFDNLTLAGIATVVAIVAFIVRLPWRLPAQGDVADAT